MTSHTKTNHNNDMAFYIHRDGEQFGPYNDSDAQQHISEGTLSPHDLAWRDGLTEWVPLSQLVAPVSARRVSAPPPPASSILLDTPKLLAIIGSVLLLFGAFTPVISVPIMGGVTFLKIGWPSYVVLGLAAASLCIVFAAPTKFLWVTGGSASLVLLGCLAKFLYGMHQAKQEMAGKPGDDDPFSKLGESLGNAMLESVQLQWGCFILGLGAALILTGAFHSSRPR